MEEQQILKNFYDQNTKLMESFGKEAISGYTKYLISTIISIILIASPSFIKLPPDLFDIVLKISLFGLPIMILIFFTISVIVISSTITVLKLKLANYDLENKLIREANRYGPEHKKILDNRYNEKLGLKMECGKVFFNFELNSYILCGIFAFVFLSSIILSILSTMLSLISYRINIGILYIFIFFYALHYFYFYRCNIPKMKKRNKELKIKGSKFYLKLINSAIFVGSIIWILVIIFSIAYQDEIYQMIIGKSVNPYFLIGYPSLLFLFFLYFYLTIYRHFSINLIRYNLKIPSNEIIKNISNISYCIECDSIMSKKKKDKCVKCSNKC